MALCTCSPATVDGHHFIAAYGAYIHDCIYTPWDQASVWLGIANIFLWLLASVPQMWNNFRSKSVTGLDIRFVLTWLVADTMSFGGAILSDQVPMVVYTSAIFSCNDMVLALQWLYYTSAYPRLRYARALSASNLQQPLKGEGRRGRSAAAGCLALLCCFCVALTLPRPPAGAAAITAASTHGAAARRLGVAIANTTTGNATSPACNAMPDVGPDAVWAGVVMAWVSNLGYVVARFPQILTNVRRQSVEGLSITMFCMGLTANLCYAVGVSLRVPSLSKHFWLTTFPYILSIAGTTCTDSFVVGQSIYYRRGARLASERYRDSVHEKGRYAEIGWTAPDA